MKSEFLQTESETNDETSMGALTYEVGIRHTIP